MRGKGGHGKGGYGKGGKGGVRIEAPGRAGRGRGAFRGKAQRQGITSRVLMPMPPEGAENPRQSQPLGLSCRHYRTTVRTSRTHGLGGHVVRGRHEQATTTIQNTASTRPINPRHLVPHLRGAARRWPPGAPSPAACPGPRPAAGSGPPCPASSIAAWRGLPAPGGSGAAVARGMHRPPGSTTARGRFTFECLTHVSPRKGRASDRDA